MTLAPLTKAKASGRRLAATLIYAALLCGLVGVSLAALAGLNERMNAVAFASDLLEKLDGKKRPPAETAGAAEPAQTGSPFLEGQTVTVAGAALQQRVGAAVRKVGGNVLSSQLELQGPQAKDGFVSLAANFEIDQPAMQQLLYDLESGMPFLFVDTLVAQSPQAVGEGEGGRMRVLIGVSGQWRETK